VVFGAEFPHRCGFVGGRQDRGLLLLVEGLDLLRDGEVLVCNGFVGDPGVDQGHGHRLVPEQRGDRLEGHAAVDGLGREGVPELVGVDVPDPSTFLVSCREIIEQPGDRL
jgi:hypothetical protein